jgi:hypothetical protein
VSDTLVYQSWIMRFACLAEAYFAKGLRRRSGDSMLTHHIWNGFWRWTAIGELEGLYEGAISLY